MPCRRLQFVLGNPAAEPKVEDDKSKTIWWIRRCRLAIRDTWQCIGLGLALGPIWDCKEKAKRARLILSFHKILEFVVATFSVARIPKRPHGRSSCVAATQTQPPPPPLLTIFWPTILSHGGTLEALWESNCASRLA